MIQSVRVRTIFVPICLPWPRPKSTYQVAFASRIKCYGQWQSAENDVRRVKSLGEKARRQGRNHAQDIADAERKATLARQEFDKVTRLLKVEMHRFDMERVEDFKKSLEALLEGMIMRQRQVRCGSYVSHLE
jgi:sorting nexin-1/2